MHSAHNRINWEHRVEKNELLGCERLEPERWSIKSICRRNTLWIKTAPTDTVIWPKHKKTDFKPKVYATRNRSLRLCKAFERCSRTVGTLEYSKLLFTCFNFSYYRLEWKFNWTKSLTNRWTYTHCVIEHASIRFSFSTIMNTGAVCLAAVKCIILTPNNNSSGNINYGTV